MFVCVHELRLISKVSIFIGTCEHKDTCLHSLGKGVCEYCNIGVTVT